ncbi:hypothetical protein B0H19DRAFT_1265329 [Mycena capillaripes]|nr:hypothetical protein B0H19DRAFT_1265329 [Mycena capillaripes]
MPLDQRPKNNGEDSEAVSIGEGRGLEDASSSASSQVSAQQQEQAQQAALLRFRPSSRDVISGFAPHLLDEPKPLRRRGSQSRRRRQTSSTECLRRSASPALHTSPLRLRVSLDEHGAIIQPEGEETVIIEVYKASSPTSLPPMPPAIVKAMPALISPRTKIINPTDKSAASSLTETVYSGAALVCRNRHKFRNQTRLSALY